VNRNPCRRLLSLILITWIAPWVPQAEAQVIPMERVGAGDERADESTTHAEEEPDQGHVPDDEGESGDEDFADLSLEDLMNVNVTTVTSVAGVRSPLFGTPAAMTVLTAEDIRRAGHRNVAEALRMVPGLHVSRISSNRWAITSRGFNGEFSNKLLVLMDGRSIYTPSFSGVYWDIQNVVLEDIDRIEVIRGPGATLWGANAVNGVINIVTKKASETRGLLLEGGGGTFERGFGAVRYGFALDENTDLRLYGQYFNRDGTRSFLDEKLPDDWAMTHGGFRLDWSDQKEYSLTFQGDFYGTDHLGDFDTEPVFYPPFSKDVAFDKTVDGGHLLLRLNRDRSTHEGWSLQMYVDRTRRAAPILDETRDTFDTEFRHRFEMGKRHKILWGLGARHSHGEFENTRLLKLNPPTRSIDLYSAFIQDTITLVPDRLSLMIGSKFEDNDFTGFEFQPSARIAWTPDEKNTLWASVSRAVRTPSIIEDDIDFTLGIVPAPAPTPIRIIGNRDIDAERLIAYEAGYRWKPKNNFLFDVAVFFNDYEDLVGTRSPVYNPFLQILENNIEAHSYGVEVASEWDVTAQWKLAAAYTFFKLDVTSGDAAREGVDPEHQFNIRSMLDITEDLELNSALYYVDHLPASQIPSYVRLDLGVTWRPTEHLEFAVWGQNLTDDRHPEFIDSFELPNRPFEVESGVFASVKYRF